MKHCLQVVLFGWGHDKLCVVAAQHKHIAGFFQVIRFTHIFREQNQVADKLSKGLELMDQHFALTESFDGESVILRQAMLNNF